MRHTEAGIGESVNTKRHWFGETEDAGRMHATLQPKEEMEAAQRSEEECKLARIMKAGTAILILNEVQLILWDAKKSKAL